MILDSVNLLSIMQMINSICDVVHAVPHILFYMHWWYSSNLKSLNPLQLDFHKFSGILSTLNNY